MYKGNVPPQSPRVYIICSHFSFMSTLILLRCYEWKLTVRKCKLLWGLKDTPHLPMPVNERPHNYHHDEHNPASFLS